MLLVGDYEGDSPLSNIGLIELFEYLFSIFILNDQ